MTQQLNLFNAALLPPKDYLTKGVMIGAALLVVAVMGGMAYYHYSDLHQLEAQYQQSTNALSDAQTQLDQLTQQQATLNNVTAINAEISKLETKHKQTENVLTILKAVSQKESQGHSAYVRAFAEQRLRGVWLTGFDIDASHQQMNVRGKAQEADLIPQYISKLGQANTFNGLNFAALNMVAKEEKENAKNEAVAKPADNNTTSAQTAASASATSSANQAYVMFSLQSQQNPDNKKEAQ